MYIFFFKWNFLRFFRSLNSQPKLQRSFDNWRLILDENRTLKTSYQLLFLCICTPAILDRKFRGIRSLSPRDYWTLHSFDSLCMHTCVYTVMQRLIPIRIICAQTYSYNGNNKIHRDARARVVVCQRSESSLYYIHIVRLYVIYST